MHDTTCARRQMLLGLSHARPLLVPTPRPGVARQCPLAAALAAGGRRRRRNAAAEQAGEHAARWPSRPQEKASGPSDLSVTNREQSGIVPQGCSVRLKLGHIGPTLQGPGWAVACH